MCKVKIFYTYIYSDTNGTPLYIGKGVNDRYKKHYNEKYRNGRPTHLSNILNKRLLEGKELKPIIVYYEDEKTALDMEKFWIYFFGRKDKGTGSLLNKTDGGDGISGFKHEDATKERIRLAHKGKPSRRKGTNGKLHTPEELLKMSKPRKIVISPDGEFLGLQAAADYYKITAQTIGWRIRNKCGWSTKKA